jgi:AraC family transcriptional regulator, regulatory protein of adaptative response / DNA-3-methyladenine glycosylase II
VPARTASIAPDLENIRKESVRKRPVPGRRLPIIGRMTLDHDAAYQVFKARDARFDGRLFVGVTSTGVYCRPVCRVRTPRQENCRFFDTPAQAEAESFRPCMKCRPEVAPGPGLAWSVMDASRTLARQAAQWLDDRLGEDDALSMTALAGHLGVSDRHLRRIFAAEHGVTPLQYLQTRRLLLAKQLLTDTRLPVAQVALASGFRSLRRFNAAFADSYRMSPSRLRHDSDEGDAIPADEALNVRLGYRPPYDVAAMLRFLGARAIPGVEHVDGLAVRRTVRAGVLAPDAGWLEARFEPASAGRAPHVRLQYAASLAAHSARVVAVVRRWLDLDANPDTIDTALAELPGGPGLRLPGSVDSFEMVVRAVLGQQVTVAAARTLARRFADRFGEPLATPWPELSHAFPGPERIAAATTEEIAELGIIRSRAGAIQALAGAWPEATRHLQERREPEPLIEMLKALPGIGPWTAHYIAMRALSWPDAFPPNDVAVLNAAKPLFGVTTQREADTLCDRWRPWRAYAVLRLWNSLA